MNRNKKGIMPEITRKVYKDVKKYDQQQFKSFCRSLYGFGYEDGRESVPGVDVEKIFEAIAATKGIGPKKLEEIKVNINALLSKEEDAKK